MLITISLGSLLRHAQRHVPRLSPSPFPSTPPPWSQHFDAFPRCFPPTPSRPTTSTSLATFPHCTKQHTLAICELSAVNSEANLDNPLYRTFSRNNSDPRLDNSETNQKKGAPSHGQPWYRGTLFDDLTSSCKTPCGRYIERKRRADPQCGAAGCTSQRGPYGTERRF